MPELPEVETVRRLLERTMVGGQIRAAMCATDDLVYQSPPDQVQASLEGAQVTAAGRKGKLFWLELADRPTLYAHLGMSGWVREIGAPEFRLLNHGNAPLDDEEGVPRFCKLDLVATSGARVVLTDGRRLARIFLGESPATEKRVAKLGPDCFTDLPSPEFLEQLFGRRKAPIKAVLMDQGLLSGIGNWVADEVLYHARIAPQRSSNSLDLKEVNALHGAIQSVLALSVSAGADADKYPSNWMFHHRWGGSKGADLIEGMEIVREQVGGRTTAWVPALQR